MKAQGKTKTATYRQLFANRFALEEMVSRLDDAGLWATLFSLFLE